MRSSVILGNLSTQLSTRLVLTSLQDHATSSASQASQLKEEKHMPGSVGFANDYYKTYGFSYRIDMNSLIIKELVGSGSFAKVHTAELNDNIIAIKTIGFKNEGNNILTLADCHRERKTMQKLTASGVNEYTVNFLGYSINTLKCEYTLAMEYLPQGSLTTFLRDHPKLSKDARYTIYFNVIEAIAYMHKQDTIHLDIKPDNILMYGRYRVKLCDFSFSKKPDAECASCGTPEYIAPEIIMGEVATKKADVYSASIAGLEIMTGKIAYEGKNLDGATLMSQVTMGMREEIPRKCSKKMSKLITWGWRNDPNERPDTDELLAEMKTGRKNISKKLASLDLSEQPSRCNVKCSIM